MFLRFDTDTGDLERAAQALADVGRELPGSFRRNLRQVADEFAEIASARALQEPSGNKEFKGHVPGTLRGKVSEGVGVRYWKQLGVQVTTRMPENDEAVIPLGMDTIKGWRHPVFGHSDRDWVQQTSGTESWFMETMKKMEQPATQKLTDTLEDAAKQIDRAT